MQTVYLRSWKQPLSALTDFDKMDSKSTPIKINKVTRLTTYLLTSRSQTHNYSTHLLKPIKMHSQLAKKKKSSHSLCTLREVVAIFHHTDTLTKHAGCTWPVEWRNRPLVAVLSTRSCCSQTLWHYTTEHKKATYDFWGKAICFCGLTGLGQRCKQSQYAVCLSCSKLLLYECVIKEADTT